LVQRLKAFAGCDFFFGELRLSMLRHVCGIVAASCGAVRLWAGCGFFGSSAQRSRLPAIQSSVHCLACGSGT
jgi:hypothetical protein